MPSTDGVTTATSVDLVLLAAPRSFCAGVEMAIKALARMVRMFGPPVYCYHEIVHNRVVVDQFRRAGVVFVDDVADVPPGAPLMLSAHGSAPEVVRAARDRSSVVVDAVCPLVKKVHREVQLRSDKGHTVLYAGHAAHDEAIGTLAVSPATTRLVESPADVATLDDIDGPVAFLAQTTLALDEWRDVLGAARARFGDVWLPGRSDLCFATTNRQAAIKAITPHCDAVVVIGSANSSNTSALVRVAQALGDARVVRINGPDELPDDLDGTVGVTAGASAPENLVQEVIERLAPRHGVEVVDVTAEDEYFPPPRELRELFRSQGAEGALDGDHTVAASDMLDDLTHLDQMEPSPAPAPAPAPAPNGASTASQKAAVDHLRAHSGRVDREMAEVVEEEVDDPWLRAAISYHLGWRDERFEPLDATAGRSGGKKLRATLAILAYQAAAASGPGSADHRHASPAPAADTRPGTGAGTRPDTEAHTRADTRAGTEPEADRRAGTQAAARTGAEPGTQAHTRGGAGAVAEALLDLEPVMPFAAAVELAHNWSLIHDDIEDGDRTRRGRPALWALCGEAQALNAGDCVQALALRCLQRLPERGVAEAIVAELMAGLARTAIELTVGQTRDLAFEQTLDVSSDRYLEMIEGKTGALLRCATWGGALLATGDRDHAELFGEFGRHLGLSFQIRDDVLGIWGAGEEMGKPTGADIRRRKKSLPIVLAFEHADDAAHTRLRRIYREDLPMTPGDERFVRETLDDWGIQRLAQDQARRHREAAVAALGRAATAGGRRLSDPPFATLHALADFVTARTH